jgi:ribokinase
MTRQLKAVVLGSINFDCVAKADRLPQKGETLRGVSFGTFVGGKGANQSVQLALLGADVTFIGRVGNDDVGVTLKNSLLGHGVNTDHLTADPEASSGACSINLDNQGQNTLLYVPGANEKIRREDIDNAVDSIREADIFITQNEINLDMLEYGLETAKHFGITTLLNPAPALPLSDSIFALADYVVPNETETQGYCGFLPDDDAALKRASEWFFGRGTKNVVITLGEQGAYYASPYGSEYAAGYRVNAVDTTAAGDAFIGGFSYIVARGGAITDAMRFANACGALAASKNGAQASLPQLDQVEEMIKSRG